VGRNLPNVARQPITLPPLSSLSRAMKIGLTSDELSQMELTVLSKWTIRPKLMSISGVANVAIWGEAAIRRDMDALQHLMIDAPSGARVSLADVADITIEPAPNVITR